jgi:hypothetical protein
VLVAILAVRYPFDASATLSKRVDASSTTITLLFKLLHATLAQQRALEAQLPGRQWRVSLGGVAINRQRVRCLWDPALESRKVEDAVGVGATQRATVGAVHNASARATVSFDWQRRRCR